MEGWRLPKVTPVNGSSFQLGNTNNGRTDIGVAATGTGWGAASEMGRLYDVRLANKGLCTQHAAGLVADGQELRPVHGPDDVCLLVGNDAAGPARQGVLLLRLLRQPERDEHAEIHSAIAVRDGDIAAAVPEPGVWALMLAGLAGLALRARRRR